MLKLSHNQLRLSLTVSCCLFGCETPQELVTNPPLTPEPVYIFTQIPTPDPPVELDIDVSREEELSKAIDVLHARLLEAYANYWPLIPSEYQHEQLPSVLGDSIPQLRVFGIERVAVLLRDGEATEDELQLVVDHLRDIHPEVRQAAAKLLPEINVPGLAEYVANSLAKESDQQVATQELIFFQTRPHPIAVTPVINRLENGPIEPAAKALIVLLNSTEISQQRKKYIVEIVKQMGVVQDIPSLITLEAMLGNIEVQRSLIHLLDSPQESTRLAVAIGFAHAGFAEPLISRANDPTMYAQALTALQKQGGIEAFIHLMDLYKEETASWDAAAFSIASSLNTSSLLRADDMLKSIHVHTLRLSILQSIWEDVPTRSLTARKAIARRAVPLMINSGDAVGALQLLDVFGDSLIDEDLLALQFSAAIAASAWDAAADVHPEPTAWIIVWQAMKDKDPVTAAVIRQQIAQRFEEQLTPSQKNLLNIEQANVTPDKTP